MSRLFCGEAREVGELGRSWRSVVPVMVLLRSAMWGCAVVLQGCGCLFVVDSVEFCLLFANRDDS